MDREIFGTDGIRGQAYIYPLDEIGARQIGKAIALQFAKPGERIVIGHDPRESSIMLENAVATGLASQGIAVSVLGVIPTAGLAYITRTSDAKAGVMITASHNPYTDNGIKVFSSEGTKLPDNVEADLNALIQSDLPEKDSATITSNSQAITSYEDFLFKSVDDIRFSNLSIALDCANGATSNLAPHLFGSLEARVITLFDKPDGKNINEKCGATNTSAVQKKVLDDGLDVGIAFDGDGDRVIMIDSKGRELDGDYLLYILALCRKESGVVATTMSNMGFENALKDRGILLIRTDVGDRYVVDGLIESGYKLGGEQSGHVIISEFYQTGDGILTALQILKETAKSGKSLSDWRDELTILPQKLINLSVKDKKIILNTEVQEFISRKNSELNGNGRLIIRASGTEPLIRVMLESSNAEEQILIIADELQEIIKKHEGTFDAK